MRPLRPIYTVQLCRMRYAYDKSTTRIVSCKSNLQLPCDCRVRHEECLGLLKHVLKPYDNRSDRQFYIVEIVCDFFMTRAARAIKIACNNLKQKSYRVNRPLACSRWRKPVQTSARARAWYPSTTSRASARARGRCPNLCSGTNKRPYIFRLVPEHQV